MEASNNATVASVGDAPHDIERAAASLVLAFDTDPFMRWMYDGPDGYLRGSAALFRVLVADARGAGGARTIAVDGRSAGTALWLPPARRMTMPPSTTWCARPWRRRCGRSSAN